MISRSGKFARSPRITVVGGLDQGGSRRTSSRRRRCEKGRGEGVHQRVEDRDGERVAQAGGEDFASLRCRRAARGGCRLLVAREWCRLSPCAVEPRSRPRRCRSSRRAPCGCRCSRVEFAAPSRRSGSSSARRPARPADRTCRRRPRSPGRRSGHRRDAGPRPSHPAAITASRGCSILGEQVHAVGLAVAVLIDHCSGRPGHLRASFRAIPARPRPRTRLHPERRTGSPDSLPSAASAANRLDLEPRKRPDDLADRLVIDRLRRATPTRRPEG